MLFTELLDQAELATEQGLGFLVLSIARRPRGDHMRLLPGLMGRVLATTQDGRTTVSVRVRDVVRWLVKHLSDVEGCGVTFMERGELEKADEMLGQFVQLRDRLGRLTFDLERPVTTPLS